MFESLKSLGKAAIGVAVETPVALAADLITLGGTLTDKREPYTKTSLEKVYDNVQEATKPEGRND